MTLRLMTWMHRNSEQATQVEQLLQALRKSDDKQKELTRELQEAKNQVKLFSVQKRTNINITYATSS